MRFGLFLCSLLMRLLRLLRCVRRVCRVCGVCVCRARPESRALASFYLQVDVFLLARGVTQSVLDLL